MRDLQVRDAWIGLTLLGAGGLPSALADAPLVASQAPRALIAFADSIVSGADINNAQAALPKNGVRPHILNYVNSGASRIHEFLHNPSSMTRLYYSGGGQGWTLAGNGAELGPTMATLETPSALSIRDRVFAEFTQKYGARAGQEMRTQVMSLSLDDWRGIVSRAIESHPTRGIVPDGRSPGHALQPIRSDLADEYGLSARIRNQILGAIRVSDETLRATRPTAAQLARAIRSDLSNHYGYQEMATKFARSSPDAAFRYRSIAEDCFQRFNDSLAQIRPGTEEHRLVLRELAAEAEAIRTHAGSLTRHAADYEAKGEPHTAREFRAHAASRSRAQAEVQARMSQLRAAHPVTAELGELSTIGARERAAISEALAREGSAGAEGLSGVTRGMRVLKVGGRILFWAGVTLMVYDGAKGSISAVRDGDPLADWVASHSPEFASEPLRNTVAVQSGFVQGVVRGAWNGAVAPAEMGYGQTFPIIYGGFRKMAGQSPISPQDRAQVSRVVEAQSAHALKVGKLLYGADYALPSEYIEELRRTAEAGALGNAAR
jgi:hypothetical protein